MNFTFCRIQISQDHREHLDHRDRSAILDCPASVCPENAVMMEFLGKLGDSDVSPSNGMPALNDRPLAVIFSMICLDCIQHIVLLREK